MKFIDLILQNSQIKEAKLYGPSKKAAERPETGITIQVPSAFHVIKDCATLANKYLPHFVFGHYANPFEVLKNKFTRSDIQEFVTEANSDIVMYQLLALILEKIKKNTSIATTLPVIEAVSHTVNPLDPYGEYDSYVSPTTTPNNTLDPVSLLCVAFGVIE
jgi:hypothetical protein